MKWKLVADCRIEEEEDGLEKVEGMVKGRKRERRGRGRLECKRQTPG